MTTGKDPSRKTIPSGLPPVKSKTTTVNKTNPDYTFSNKLQIHKHILIMKHECVGNQNGQFNLSDMHYGVYSINNKGTVILNKNFK
jgi:hypothetical protein